MKFETMEQMAKRLYGCSSSGQVFALIEAIKAINTSAGCLEEQNRATAIYHLAVALGGEGHAQSTIKNLTFYPSNPIEL